MEQRGPWRKFGTSEVWRGAFFRVFSDQVTSPGGAATLDGTIGCAPSAQLVLSTALTRA
jgi:hypothetical protein